ncbi:hypothetical protein EV670_1662 [Rivibacter subsaxonicus]|uniref:Uncharacterized protein n=1 Tax=Rivibacter subsaxonicus TaxID=457575 RepID=A0A4Q7VX90_9BURK|nr:hypothetical protein EV670_1662 [Rivibacter subsaxonicus]
MNTRLLVPLRQWPAVGIAALGGVVELFALWRARLMQRRA